MNVALNRPTFMSSVFYNPLYGYYWPWKANDGNSDPIAAKVDHSCAHTETGSNNWWAVDLGVPLSVAGILFTNRAETMGNVHICTERQI